MSQMSNPARPLTDPGLPPDIHIVIDGADVGPVEAGELRRLYQEDRIGPSTLAWHPALDDWAEIGQMPELAWIIAPPAPPVAEPVPASLAHLPARLLAGGVDLAIWLIVLALIALPLGFAPVLEGTKEDPQLATRFDLLAQFASAVYFILPMSSVGGGATPGYRLLGLRLVAAETMQPPGILRTLVWYMMTYLDLVGWLTYFFDSKRRMLHNIVSDTLVVSVRGQMSQGT